MAAPLEWLTPEQIQARFNTGGYYERMQDDDDQSVHLGEIEDVAPSPSDFPTYVRSQMVTYLDQFDDTIVIAHQNGRSNGLAAEGTRPDPKYLFEGGVRYKALRPGQLPPDD